MSRISRIGFICVLVGVLARLGGAAAQQPPPPPQEPQLRIEPRMHTAPLVRIGVNAACTQLATGSHDKTVRLWRLPEGRLLRTLRVPAGPGNDGKIYSVAMAPDGSWVAAGGWDTAARTQRVNFVYIFDTATGAVAARLGPFANVINHLAVSADGTYLAVLVGSEGLRVWERTSADARQWQVLATDRDYGGKMAYGAAFDRRGTLYTVGYDRKLRRYQAPYGGKPISVLTKGGSEPHSVEAHPSGDRVAVGFVDNAGVDIYDAATLAWRAAANVKGVDNGNVGSVAWSADGTRLYAAGRYVKAGKIAIRVWDRAGLGAPRDITGPLTTIMHLLPCGDGIVFGAAEPAFGVLDGKGNPRTWQDSVQADMRGKRFEHFTVSADGRRLRFGFKEYGGEPVLFDLTAATLTDAANAVADLTPGDTQGLPVSDWINDARPKFAGAPLALEPYEVARALAIAPNKQRFVLGTEYWLRAYDAQGKPAWQTPVPAVAWGANIPREAKVVIVAYGDGTIRWHRLDDGQELLALFVHAKDRRWVAWTPRGYYTASPGGEDLIGWHVNRDWNDAADFFSVARFRDQFYRPDIVRLVLSTLDEAKTLEQANQSSKRSREMEDIAKRLPPVINILSPNAGGGFSSADLLVSYSVRSPSGLPIKRVRALIDGVPAEGGEAKGFAPVSSAETPGELRLKVPPRDVILALIAETETNESTPVEIDLKWTGAKPSLADLEKPELYALLVGVSAYRQSQWALKYAAKDARDFAGALTKLKGGLYRDVHIELLADEQATERNVRQKLASIKRTMTSRDIALFFFSGHGVTLPDQSSFLLPVDFDDKDIESTGYNKRLLLDELKRFPSKALVFLDACQSAGGLEGFKSTARFDTVGLINEFKSAGPGLITFASSLSRQLSAELGALQNGIFTKALLEGFGGSADVNGDKIIDTVELDLYLTRRVKQLSKGYQDAIMDKPTTMPHFPIARVP
jgi:Caspase domain/WD domain, G-beta repeat